MKHKVFLGGTVTGCNPLYGWRGKLIPMLNMEYFNPVLKNWNKEAINEEYKQKYEICRYSLFVITPEIRGYLSIAEVSDMVNKNPNGTIFCVINETFENNKKFTKDQLRSLDNVGDLVTRNGGKYFKDLEQVANYLNKENERKIYRLDTGAVKEWCIARCKQEAYEFIKTFWDDGLILLETYEKPYLKENPEKNHFDFINDFCIEENENTVIESDSGEKHSAKEWLDLTTEKCPSYLCHESWDN